ncbi:hypothetical protein GQ53DRAFT_879311 [Thozetella sp. PMI_491]|nr:hypothetical protein GQ53DRAFT_879311 [Thozetella sp. PMI_491]
MAQNNDLEEEASQRNHGKPYGAKHPVPTVQGYREHRAHIKEEEEQEGKQQIAREEAGESEVGEVGKGQPGKSVNPQDETQLKSSNELYPTANRHVASQTTSAPDNPTKDHEGHGNQSSKTPVKDKRGGREGEDAKSATEEVAATVDPKKKRKIMKSKKRHGKGREVTDPVTHLPVTIHDMTDKSLDNAPENNPDPSSGGHRTATGQAGASKSQTQLDQETDELQGGHDGMRNLFPPPDFNATKNEMMETVRAALTIGLGAISGLAVAALMAISMVQSKSWILPLPSSFVVLAAALGAVGLTYGVSGYAANKVDDIFEDEVWDAAKSNEMSTDISGEQIPESVDWLNNLVTSVWPLINPDLFTSLADTLEDVMQASLPKVIRMVSVDDIGQGSEAIRILGIRWLPTGAASQSIDQDGRLSKSKGNDRQDSKEGEQQEQSIREGMEAEEGDFVNMELAFAYRTRSSGKSIKRKAKNAHLYLKFYLPGGIAVPVWVELKGIIGIMRLRLQLTPDPPFFSLCTLTFLGQPRANLSCVPLSKHNLNIMNVPLISKFVQSSVDAALAEYVAPKSLTLDLKDMLVGDDFKKDTLARGVIFVHIKKAVGFKQGDGGFGPMEGSSDAYVTVSWGKFGKALAATRVIVAENEPVWDEWAYILVSPEEINANESLRLQLWDSDKYTADDDLGRVELTLKELMHGSKTKNRMADREDGFHGEDPDEKLPGTLTWSVGWFSKVHIQQSQLDQQTVDKEIRSVEELKKQVSETAASKLREATFKDESSERHQQTVQDFKEREDEMMISAPPPDGFPSGILSVQIHNITGLEVARLNRRSNNDEDREDEAEQSDNLPDSYCTIILNHRKVYRTRTKPKNAKPFFNAGTERFVSDWQTTEVMVSVRDSREAENDPLLGIVYLPLRRVFQKRSQIMETFPLAGGIGHGRIRISMVWRSVELKLEPQLRGWEYGTLEVKAPIKAKGSFGADSIDQCKLKLKTKLGSAKMYSSDDGWRPKKQDQSSLFLGVTKRYASPLTIEFRQKSVMSDNTPAIAVLWMNEIPDEEEKTVTLKVWHGGKDQLKRARSCAEYAGLKEGEEPIGEIELTLRLWRGLSGYHKSYASKSRNHDMRDVMEVLDTINDEKMTADEAEDDDIMTDSDSDSEPDYDKLSSTTSDKRSSQEEIEKRKMLRKADADSSSSEDDGSGKAVKKLPGKIKQRASSLLSGPSGSEDDGSRGPLAQVQDYKKHHKQLHRSHKGVMQWKTARTLDWMAGKANMSKGRLGDVFKHGEKEAGIETEV